MLNLNGIQKIHFIGVGGVSMSGLALLMRSFGKEVTGSDREFSQRLGYLTEHGCNVYVGTDVNTAVCSDLTVFSSAICESNKELSAARNIGVPCMERHVFLREISRYFGATIAIAGTHGKTTCTAMTAKIFFDAKYDFCAHIGGDSVDLGNFHYSGNKVFITEACEYRRSLLSLRPDVGVILNAERDHPDTYSSLSEIYDTFDAFASLSRTVLVNSDSDYYAARKTNADAFTFGCNNDASFRIYDIGEYKKGYFGCSFSYLGIPLQSILLPIPGRHNVYNACAAFASSYIMKLCPADAAISLNSFGGIKRRFEYNGLFCSARVYNDYAHHPSEIKAAINTAKMMLGENKKLYTVFQPHTYSRTRSLMTDFIPCFDGSDKLIIMREYAAREKPEDGADAKKLYLRVNHPDKIYCDNTVDAAEYLMRSVSPDDVILILGAGDVVCLADILCPKDLT